MASFACQSRDALMGRTLTLLRRSLGLVLGFGGPRLRRQDGVDWLRGVAIASKIEPLGATIAANIVSHVDRRL
jgi:hypothetical protein